MVFTLISLIWSWICCLLINRSLRSHDHDSFCLFPSRVRFIEYALTDTVKDIKLKLAKLIPRDQKEIRLSLKIKTGYALLDETATIDAVPIQDDVPLFSQHTDAIIWHVICCVSLFVQEIVYASFLEADGKWGAVQLATTETAIRAEPSAEAIKADEWFYYSWSRFPQFKINTSEQYSRCIQTSSPVY